MNRLAAYAGITATLLRFGVSLGAAVALLTGCGVSQMPVDSSSQRLAQQQSPVRNDYHILHTFGDTEGDGTHSSADLVDVKGVLYGTTSSGGSHDAGTVFSITTSGQETVLHSFGGPGDGVEPTARLLNVNGTLYGTTSEGGHNYGGTVFSMSLDGGRKKCSTASMIRTPPPKKAELHPEGA